MPFIDINSIQQGGSQSSTTPVPATDPAATPTTVNAQTTATDPGTAFPPVMDDTQLQPIGPMLDLSTDAAVAAPVETEVAAALTIPEVSAEATPATTVTETAPVAMPDLQVGTEANAVGNQEVVSTDLPPALPAVEPMAEVATEPVKTTSALASVEVREVKGPDFPADEVAPNISPLAELESVQVEDKLANMDLSGIMPVVESSTPAVSAVADIAAEPVSETPPVVDEPAVDVTSDADTTLAAAEPTVEAEIPVPTPSEPPMQLEPQPAAADFTPPSLPTEDSVQDEASAATALPSVANLESGLVEKEYTLSELLSEAIAGGASDVHLAVGYRAMMRVDGSLVNLPSSLLDEAKIKVMLEEIVKGFHTPVDLNEVRDLDLSYSFNDQSRFRVNIFRQQGSLSAALRLIPPRISTVEELHLPASIRELTKLSQGLVLVTGPTGSGKSTTIASLLNEINSQMPKHIVTIEDPIEYVYPQRRALVEQREMHRDTDEWSVALRSVLRQDPDVVLVGEMRDLETIAAAVTTAETGHLVFATLHTNSAAQSIDRIIDVFPPHQQNQIRTQLASVIKAVISQRLIPVKGGGRRAAIELLMANSAVSNNIREGKIYQIDNIIQTSAEEGMITMEKSLVELVRNGMISTDQALAYSNKPDDVLTLLGKRSQIK